MAFQAPITIKEALKNIESNKYLLPAIQREVVWSTDQIVRLFDSLMQEYPIGSFLMWNVEEENSKEYTFYEFMTHYHGLQNRHLKRHELSTKRPITGVLDGQQRLTALNIGLRGSYSQRIPRSWAHIPSNYPKTELYLRLDEPAPEGELGLEFDFRFLKEEAAQQLNEGDAHWFRVKEIMDFDPDLGIIYYLEDHGLSGRGNKFPALALTRLHRLVHRDQVINFFLEPSQDLDKVLNIFIRVNSGGTQLSYSDLLLSIAVAQWTTIDAREVIHGLVDELNGMGKGFSFNKDQVLKAGLMLNDIPSVAFRVTNFNSTNMAVLEANWDSVADALRLATRLVASFGFSDRDLSAYSAVLPIAYYLKLNNFQEPYLTHHSHATDREAIRTWLNRSILKGGIWGSGLDTLLMALRSVLQQHGNEHFPTAEIEAEMSRRGKSLRFDIEEIEELSTMHIKDRRVFSFLSLLYPGMDMKNDFHIDHVFPANAFSVAKLRKAGVIEDDIQALMDAYNRLPNLQLLEGPINQSKQDKLPHIWAESAFVNDHTRIAYFDRHMLGTIPEELVSFLEFYETRRRRIVERSMKLLSVGGEQIADA